jgi:hypothetical protein
MLTCDRCQGCCFCDTVRASGTLRVLSAECRVCNGHRGPPIVSNSDNGDRLNALTAMVGAVVWYARGRQIPWFKFSRCISTLIPKATHTPNTIRWFCTRKRHSTAAVAVEAKPLLEVEAKKNQLSGLKRGQEPPRSVKNDKTDKPIDSRKEVAKQFDVSQGYVYAAQNLARASLRL